jgi:hypothetical protein
VKTIEEDEKIEGASKSKKNKEIKILKNVVGSHTSS